MGTDSSEMLGEKHPSIAELKDSSHPHIAQHIESCAICRAVAIADEGLGAPIPLVLPKGLVSENAFRWPADPLARGGMSLIFLGEDRRLGRKVILKAPVEDDDLSAGMAEMFERRVISEARILAKLQHPSIVTIYELGKASAGWPFCILENVDGISLRNRLDDIAQAEYRDGGPRTRERLELLSNVAPVAEALAYAHEHRVVHRDCTPNNILLDKRGKPTLIDWGIACDLDAPGGSTERSLLTNEASVSGRGVTISAGTPPYLPYEQSQGRAADPSFDVYSFGVTLYEVVSGRTPFDWKMTNNQHDRMRQLSRFLEWLKRGDPVPPAMPRDPELSGIIACAIAHDRVQRFTADELVRALKQYLTAEARTSLAHGLVQRLAVVRPISSAKKGKEATEAKRDVDAAKAPAEQEVRERRDATELHRAGHEKQGTAEQKCRTAEAAAVSAKIASNEAQKKLQEAQQSFQEAQKKFQEAMDEAEAELNAAKTAQAQVERLCEAAEEERDAAVATRVTVEKERDTAVAARVAVEKERDVARRKVAELEAKLRETSCVNRFVVTRPPSRRSEG